MKILSFDIETAPNLGLVWGKWEQNVIAFERDWYMLCFAAKWLGQRKVMTAALPDFKRYKRDPEDDKDVVLALWKLLDEADIVVAHNGDAFDIKKANARFIMHGMKPPSTYKTVDTLKVARAKFKFDSNTLNDLGEYLGLGKKAETGGFKLWRECMLGVPSAWKKMIKYNKRDVTLLEDIYLVLRPWMTNHPNVNVLDGKDSSCPMCSSKRIQSRGFGYTKTGLYRRYQCQECGGWFRGKAEKGSTIELR